MTSSSNIQQQHHDYQFVIVGEEDSGKTTFLSRFIVTDTQQDNKFIEEIQPSVGIDLRFSPLKYNKNLFNIRIVHKSNQWDVSGRRTYRATTTQYLKNIKGVFYLFDLNENFHRNTFLSLNQWIKSLVDKNNKNIVKIFVGTKYDKIKSKVNKEEIIKKIKSTVQEYNYHFIYTSAKQDINVHEAFIMMLDLLMGNYVNPSEIKDCDNCQNCQCTIS